MWQNSLFKKWGSYCSLKAEKMKLFKHQQNFSRTDVNPLICSTPLGMGYFDCVINGKSVHEIKPSMTEMHEEVTISYWNLKECHIELLKANFNPKIPPDMRVEAAIAGIWRIRNLDGKLKLLFKTFLISEAEGDPETRVF